MLENLQSQPIPELFTLVQQYAEDTRSLKMDLGLGMFCNADGITPIFSAVKKAESRITDTEITKAYGSLTGNAQFRKSFGALVLGDDFDFSRVASAATPGGTGALYMLLNIIHGAHPNATIWIPNVTWVNHQTQAEKIGLKVKPYTYYNATANALDFHTIKSDLNTVKSHDVVLVHGCCQNPSGIDLSPLQWQELTAFFNDKGVTPMIDIAYQGFATGLDEDAQGMRYMVTHSPQSFVLVSGSKNFGLYKERIGLAMVISNPTTAPITQSHLAQISRLCWSMPPDHGAKVIDTILCDAHLRAEWSAELDDMRAYVKQLRTQLRDTFHTYTNSQDFHFLTEQNGMFSLLPITAEQTVQLKKEYAIYMLPSGRTSIASIKADLIEYFVKSFLAVTRN